MCDGKYLTSKTQDNCISLFCFYVTNLNRIFATAHHLIEGSTYTPSLRAIRYNKSYSLSLLFNKLQLLTPASAT